MSATSVNFNPRSREGSDDEHGKYNFNEKIDFNPRSREGSDALCSMCTSPRGNFNPRSREGSDEYGGSINTACKSISIHAPARGAT